MCPSLLPGDRLLARARVARVGDVVVFPEPAGSRFYVKRVVATGGSRVTIGGHSLTIVAGGRAQGFELPHSELARSWELLDDEVFVLSDDMTVTRADSRVFGPIDTAGMFTVFLRYWPSRRLGIRL